MRRQINFNKNPTSLGLAVQAKKGSRFKKDYRALTSSACKPFAPLVTVNSTR